MKLKSGVYSITNLNNGKLYIGSTSLCLVRRMRDHLNSLRRGDHGNLYLQNAWNKYGEEAFKFEVVVRCKPESCIKKEQYYINKTKCADPEYGYNIRKVAESNRGIKWRRKESGQKLSASLKAYFAIPENREQCRHNLGKKESTETRKKKSIAHKGKPKSEQTKANMKLAWIKRKLKQRGEDA